LADLGNQLRRDVETAAVALVGEGPQESGVFVAAGAGGTVGADAGFAHFGKGAFEGRPESGQLVEELLAERVGITRANRHGICMLYNIHTTQAKKISSADFRKTGHD
jgi:hypothetical protein